MIISIQLIFCFGVIHGKDYGIFPRNKGKLTIKGGACVFPFSYRGVVYTDCAPGVNQPLPWCATSTKDDVSNTVDDWDICATDKGVVVKICKFLDKNGCQDQDIKNLCPQMCSKGVDDKICNFLDQDDCKGESIKEKCPQMCSAAVCDPICVNGDCTAHNKCSCLDGWAGDLCDEPVCDPTCVNGDCTAHNKCSCLDGWAGDICDEPMCEPECRNGKCIGKCLGHRKCSCNGGWFGDLCDKRCPDDLFYFEPSDQCFKYPNNSYDRFNTWTHTNDYCKSFGLELAKPKDPILLRKYMMDNYAPTTFTWLGARGTGSSIQWLRDGETISPNDPLWTHDVTYSSTSKFCMFLWTVGSSKPNKPIWMNSCITNYRVLCELVLH